MICMDFDGTSISHDSTWGYIDWLGHNSKNFFEHVNEKWSNTHDWNMSCAYLSELIKLDNVNKQSMIEYAKTLKLCDGLPSFKRSLQENHPDKNIKFYIMSAGVDNIVGNIRFKRMYDEIFASRLEYDDTGKPIQIKYPITGNDKVALINMVRYFQTKTVFKPNDIKKEVPKTNIIYIGDSTTTDWAAWSLVNEFKGLSIAVTGGFRWSKEFIDNRGVLTNGLYNLDYTKNSSLFKLVDSYISNLN